MASLNSASEPSPTPSGAETANRPASNANENVLSPLLDLLVEAGDVNPTDQRAFSNRSSVTPVAPHSVSGLSGVADEFKAEPGAGTEQDAIYPTDDPAPSLENDRLDPQASRDGVQLDDPVTVDLEGDQDDPGDPSDRAVSTIAPYETHETQSEAEPHDAIATQDEPLHPFASTVSPPVNSTDFATVAETIPASVLPDYQDSHPIETRQAETILSELPIEATPPETIPLELLDENGIENGVGTRAENGADSPLGSDSLSRPHDEARSIHDVSPEALPIIAPTDHQAETIPPHPAAQTVPPSAHTSNPPPANPPEAVNSSAADFVSASSHPTRSPHRIKLSPQTLRQRTTIGEFVEPLEPAPPAPPRIQTPKPPTPPNRPPASDSIPHPTPPTPPRPNPIPAPSSAIVPISEARLAQLEARLIELEAQFDFSDIDGTKEKQVKLMPLVDEILSSLTPTALRQETIRSIIPVIDRIIIERSEQNRDAMSAAISDLMPQAIARQIESDPCAIAEAVAPEMAEAIRRQIALKKGVLAEAISSEMGEAIRRQILLAREEMVDALYPVIGNTITKYMSEEIRNINAKVEQSFSLEGMTRKIRAKLQGVSEAELILRDAASFTVKAAFLIHKESGLVIAEAQQPNATPLESDMIGGMLTAIRSFANDCIAQADAGNTAELNEIEYDTFKLVLEVAGYCYVALVVKGAITKSYVNHMRLVMVGLVQDYGPAIKDFDGDPSTIPDEIAIKIASLVPDPIDLSQEHAQNAKHPPALLVLLILGVLGGAMFWARQSWQKRVEATVLQKIDRVPELTAYQIDVEAKGNRLELAGDLPSRSLQEKLIAVVTPLVPDREIVDRTQLTTFEPDEATISAEVDRLTALLNRTLPATVVTQYQNRRITLKGWAEDETVLAAIGNAFEAIPGVQSVSSALLIDAPPDKIRLYFELGETNPIAIGERKLESVERFLREFPSLHLDIIGHADRLGSTEQNRALSQARADRIRQLLINRGISADRLSVRGSLELPPGIDPQQSLELSRCVRFEIRDRDPAATETAP